MLARERQLIAVINSMVTAMEALVNCNCPAPVATPDTVWPVCVCPDCIRCGCNQSKDHHGDPADCTPLHPAVFVDEDEPPSPPDRYQIPGPPPRGSRVTDDLAGVWEYFSDNADDEAMFRRVGTQAVDIDRPPAAWSWLELLDLYGPLTRVPDEDDEDARLYGPRTQRWGQPDVSCPHRYCVLGTGHVGPHTNAANEPMGQTAHATAFTTASITPAEASLTACTCLHPERHRLGCARFLRESDPFDFGGEPPY